MDSLLDALQEGRLIELPDNDKFHALQFLAHIIEAIPSVPNGTDVAGFVLSREKSAVTALGKGFACPHARVSYDDDLICSVGWSPQGIDYGSSDDNKPVHIVIMYLVPDNQRNHYLKEVSNLAKALMNSDSDVLSNAQDLDAVRNYLLDLVSNTKSIAGTETRARMIQLETRGGQLQEVQNLSNLLIEPVTIVSDHNVKQIILAQNKEVADVLDNSAALVETIITKGIYEKNGWRVIKKSSVEYQLDRSIIECIAVKVNSNNNGGLKKLV